MAVVPAPWYICRWLAVLSTLLVQCSGFIPSISIPALTAGQRCSFQARGRMVQPRHNQVQTIRAMIIKEEDISLSTPTGLMRTKILRPAAPGKYPGVVFYSEIFQNTPPIIRAASVIAGHGFVVIVPEIYHDLVPGWVGQYDDAGAERGNELKITKSIEAYDSDSKVAVDYLLSNQHCTGKVGVMGFCIGGHLSFRAAMNPGVLAASCYYPTDIHKGSLGKGMKDNSLERVTELARNNVEMQMIFGRQDPHVDQEGRLKIYKRLAETGTSFTWHEFNGMHAFMRDEGYRYDPELSHLCTRLTVGLFQRKLADGDLPEDTIAPVSALDAKC